MPAYYDTEKNRYHQSRSTLPAGRGNTIGLRGATDAVLAANGILPCNDEPAPDGMVATGAYSYEIADGAAKRVPVCITQEAHDAATIAAQTAALSKAKAKIGLLVSALRARLVAVGWDLPCDSQELMLDLISRSDADAMTPQQEKAKSELIDMYIMLLLAGATDQQIADVWAYIQAGGE